MHIYAHWVGRAMRSSLRSLSRISSWKPDGKSGQWWWGATLPEFKTRCNMPMQTAPTPPPWLTGGRRGGGGGGSARGVLIASDVQQKGTARRRPFAASRVFFCVSSAITLAFSDSWARAEFAAAYHRTKAPSTRHGDTSATAAQAGSNIDRDGPVPAAGTG